MTTTETRPNADRQARRPGHRPARQPEHGTPPGPPPWTPPGKQPGTPYEPAHDTADGPAYATPQGTPHERAPDPAYEPTGESGYEPAAEGLRGPANGPGHEPAHKKPRRNPTHPRRRPRGRTAPPTRRDTRRPGRPPARRPSGELRPHEWFAERLVLALSGQRPMHWLLGHTAGRAYDQLAAFADELPLRGGPRPELRACGYCRPAPDVIEAFARVAVGDRLRALAFRLELGPDRRWRCAAVEMDPSPQRDPA